MGGALFLTGAGAFAAGEVVQAFRLRREAARVDPRAEIFFRLMFFGAIVMVPLGRALAPGGGRPLFVTGMTIGLLGLLLRWWSFAALGRYFTVVLRVGGAQEVVDRGPYRVLRHPGYTGLILIFAGAGLAAGSWLGAAGATALILLAVLHRIRIEEKALIAALGDRYVRFAATRARLIPYIW
ncbi:methyltransferase family protein [Paractinoplanes lichenicola]|uniref:Isoprenylcysteine carboxylmethyltransferase family protein n=1 Tax=Paractinoplanes lichenicola TaxID=2802976 RepID=A0ABS1W4H4_9ACTN|nr:isoprenylcysteine carboxylmethyltransferase family protein [Actinoplanes lichenicola]MBL7261628.1 isoprenylcysteine carboxylmethyltransferase family protein [Actinoplanes lichenicola]